MDPGIVKINDRPELIGEAAKWFCDKWGVPEEEYEKSMKQSLRCPVPRWYVVLRDGGIIAGAGVIENDFHDRPDLSPNVCAVYVEEEMRRRGIAGKLLDFICRDMKKAGVGTLYLLTGHEGFYERYGWEFYCLAHGFGEDEPSRMYVHC